MKKNDYIMEKKNSKKKREKRFKKIKIGKKMKEILIFAFKIL